MKEANGRFVKPLAPAVSSPSIDDPSMRRNAAYPREFLHNRLVYVVVSPRARGLSVGVNMNPDKLCQFNCIYCEVDRQDNSGSESLDVGLMAGELKSTLEY